MTSTEEGKVPTLKEAIALPQKHRDLTLAMQPMPNYTSTGKFYQEKTCDCQYDEIHPGFLLAVQSDVKANSTF
eukprot:scaffold1395_cov152-Amphora_coffeaeformis.AAC.19